MAAQEAGQYLTSTFLGMVAAARGDLDGREPLLRRGARLFRAGLLR